MADTLDSCPKSGKNPKLGDDPEANVDRLSALPDSLLLRIISRLPFAEVVRTGVLSTKWKNLWKHVDEISLRYVGGRCTCWTPSSGDNFFHRRNQYLVDAINRTLIQSGCFTINKFSLYAHHRIYEVEVVEKLIQWPFLRNVKTFTWDNRSAKYFRPCVYRPSEWLWHCSSLENLTIEGFVRIQVGDLAVRLASLKNLRLISVKISYEDIAKILSGCPVLESLVLEDSYTSMAKLLNITSPSVKTLRVMNRGMSCNFTNCLINAPLLETLDCDWYCDNGFLCFENVSSMLKTNINLSWAEEIGEDALQHFLGWGIQLLSSLFHVEELVLGNYIIHALSMMRLQNKPCPLLRCKHLTICLFASRHEFPTTAYLFQRTPCIETLVIKVEHKWDKDKIGAFNQGISDVDGAYGFTTPKVDFQHLKYVKILHTCSWFARQCVPEHIMECYFRLAACIMRNAHFLKELVITLPGKVKNCGCRVGSKSESNASKHFTQLCDKFYSCFWKWFEDDDRWEVDVRMQSFEIVCRSD